MHAVEQHSQRKARVGICVTTFRRPALLRQLLLGLARLTFDRMPTPDILIVVVDNDISRSAADICDSASLPWRSKYVVETRRGIAQARNRAIQEAENPDFIVFIDDDEVPSPLWLDELLWTQACFEADVVCGPVLPRFSGEVPDWIKAGRFFSQHICTTGDPMEIGWTGNVLISRKVVTALRSFDERFGLTGGEDTHFFLRARRAGFAIVSSGGGVVYESVPESRGSLRWLLRRAYQNGNSWVHCESSLDGRTSTRIVRALKASARIVQGATSACLSPVFGKAALAHALSTLFLGVGMIAALAGRSFQAYQAAGTEAPR
jgi:glycosyltransferase involved in cell wall biosynthesis